MSHSPTRTNPELRFLGRFLVGLLALICIVTVCAVITGCAGATGLVTARVKITQGSNVVEVVQPKDTTIDKLTIDPRTGAFTLQGYASAGNAEAIAAGRAQAEAQSAMWAQTIGFLREAGGAMAAAYGVPTGKLAAFVIHESYEGSAGILLRRPDGWLQRAIRFGGPLVLDRRDWLLAADGSEFGLWHAHDWNSPNFIPLPADTLKILGLLRTETGEFWVGTSKGALHYAPQSLPPDTRFTGTGALRNGHLEGFEVAGIAPFSPTSRPSRFLFSWRVDSDSWSGYADWPKEGIPVGDRAPGNHRLEVRARDGLGLEDPTPAEFSFAVVPVPIQDRPWFRPVLAVVGGGFGVLCLALTSATLRNTGAIK
jgi:hypothetical protein